MFTQACYCATQKIKGTRQSCDDYSEKLSAAKIQLHPKLGNFYFYSWCLTVSLLIGFLIVGCWVAEKLFRGGAVRWLEIRINVSLSDMKDLASIFSFFDRMRIERESEFGCEEFHRGIAREQLFEVSEYISAVAHCKYISRTPFLIFDSISFYFFVLLFLSLSSALEPPNRRRTRVGTNFLFSIWRNRNSFSETKKICYFHSHLAYRTASRFFLCRFKDQKCVNKSTQTKNKHAEWMQTTRNAAFHKVSKQNNDGIKTQRVRHLVWFAFYSYFAISWNDNGIQLKAVSHFSIKLNKSRRKRRDAFSFFILRYTVVAEITATMTGRHSICNRPWHWNVNKRKRRRAMIFCIHLNIPVDEQEKAIICAPSKIKIITEQWESFTISNLSQQQRERVAWEFDFFPILDIFRL